VRDCSRRRFLRTGLGLASLGLLAGCGSLAPWTRPTKVSRVGVLLGNPANPSTIRFRDAFLRGLGELGYADGQNVTLELRYTGSGQSQPEQAAELARLPVEVIVVAGDSSMAAARQASETIPIVFALNSAPVEAGIVASLARPGGNITGLSEITPES
jgi:putative tryptophan/tyrosine transport system substrate-binding protein